MNIMSEEMNSSEYLLLRRTWLWRELFRRNTMPMQGDCGFYRPCFYVFVFFYIAVDETCNEGASLS